MSHQTPHIADRADNDPREDPEVKRPGFSSYLS